MGGKRETDDGDYLPTPEEIERELAILRSLKQEQQVSKVRHVQHGHVMYIHHWENGVSINAERE